MASSQFSTGSLGAYTDIKTASIVCMTCRGQCQLSWRVCPICEAAPRLDVGGYSFVGAKRTLYDASTGPALANSVVFLGRAHRPKAGSVGASDVVVESPEVQKFEIAMKSVPLDGEASSVEMARREIQVFQSLGSKHPNLLPLLFGAETESELVLLTPYAPGGDLHALTCVNESTYRCLEEVDAGALTSQLLAGLMALHGARCLHGDVKPQNVFLTEADGAFVAQWGDFGLARFIPEGEEGVPGEGGTPGYMAPEMVGHEVGTTRSMVSYSVDLFALGVMLYQLLSSMSPFDPPSNVRALLEFDDGCWDPLAPSAREFVTLILDKDPKARGTSLALSTHPWLEAAAQAPRGVEREIMAPQTEKGIRFHTAEAVLELQRIQPQDLS